MAIVVTPLVLVDGLGVVAGWVAALVVEVLLASLLVAVATVVVLLVVHVADPPRRQSGHRD